MAESYSVKAILSATDKGFTSVFNAADKTAGRLKSILTGGLGFGALAAVGSKAISVVGSSVGDLIGEIDSSNIAWKTFDGNMSRIGKSEGEIKAVKNELQDFATKSVYSASDMATTYSALAAMGTKSTDKLVKGFGGLAAAAENPQQAMKTLSQQAVQMAAKPTVAWEDFKLMQEQTGTSLAAVAEHMGMSMQDMVGAVKDGKIATEDFFDAITEVGTNDVFTDMATSYKSAGQAMDGLKETLATKLAPTFEMLGDKAIGVISKISDGFSSIDGDALANKVKSMVDAAVPKVLAFKEKLVGAVTDFIDSFKSTGAVKAVSDAFSAIGDAVGNIKANMPKDTSFFDAVGKLAGKGVKMAADAIKAVADAIAGMSPEQMKVAGVVLKSIAGGFLAFKIAGKVYGPIKKLAGLFGKGSPLSKDSNPAGGIVSLKEGFNSFQKSAGIAAIIASLALLAWALEPLASLGNTAIAPLLTFGGVVAGLAIIFSKFGAGLKTNVVGIGVFAAAVALMALAMAPVAATGTEGAVAMAAFGLVIAALVAVFAIFGTALNAAIPAMLAFGAVILMVGAGLGMAAPGIDAISGLVQQLGETFAVVADAIAGAVERILPVIGNLVTTISEAVTKIVEVIGTTLCQVMTTAGDTIAKIADAIGDNFLKISDGVATVIDAISGGLTDILNGIASIIESVGNSARNAGEGFLLVAEGIATIAGLSLWDIGKSLGAVAIGLGEISTKGKTLPEVATGMQNLVSALGAAAGNLAAFNAAVVTMSSVAAGLSASLAIITSAFADFTITAPDIGPVTAAFAQLVVAAKTMATETKSAIKSGFDLLPGIATAAMGKFNAALRAGGATALSIMTSAAKAIVSAATAAVFPMHGIGYNIGAGLANGMEACLGRVRSVAAQLAAAAEQAIRAKAQIHSPSRVATKLGNYWGGGYVNGIIDMIKDARNAAKKLVSAPKIETYNGTNSSRYSAGSRELQKEYDYRPTVYVQAEVTSVMDGRRVGYGSAKYVEEKNTFDNQRRSRLGGVVHV